MKFNAYGGITTAPANQEAMDGSQFKNYFTGMLQTQGYNDSEINSMYPWLNGGPTSENITGIIIIPIGRTKFIVRLLYQNFTSFLKGVMILPLITFQQVILPRKVFWIILLTQDTTSGSTVKLISQISSRLFRMPSYRWLTVKLVTRDPANGKMQFWHHC